MREEKDLRSSVESGVEDCEEEGVLGSVGEASIMEGMAVSIWRVVGPSLSNV